MSSHLYLAPAAAGKTAYVLTRARTAAQSLAAVPRVVVPAHLQARAARRRLPEMGGAIGMRALTFDRFYAEVLDAAGEIHVELSEAVQYRLIRAVVESLPQTPYAPLADRTGFIQVLQRLIGELKAARIHPDDFARAVRAMGDEPRLAELAHIYAAYQTRLRAQGWVDRAGLGWLAVHDGYEAVRRWAEQAEAVRTNGVAAAVEILQVRVHTAGGCRCPRSSASHFDYRIFRRETEEDVFRREVVPAHLAR